MFEIVAFHVSEKRLPIVGGLGLPVFLLLNNAFNCTLAERMGARAFLRTKLSRLLLPWVLWSLIYVGVVAAERIRHGEPLGEGFTPWMLIGGTYEHLWFVPFALLGSLVVAWLQQSTARADAWRATWLSLLAGAALAPLCGWLLLSTWLEWPLPQWLFALPAVPLGFALGRALLGQSRALLSRAAWFAVAAAMVCLVLSLRSVVPETVRRYAFSLSLVLLAFSRPGEPDEVSRRLAPLLFGIYLSHPLIVRLYQAAHLPPLPTAPFAAMVFLASAVLVAVLQRGPLRYLV